MNELRQQIEKLTAERNDLKNVVNIRDLEINRLKDEAIISEGRHRSEVHIRRV